MRVKAPSAPPLSDHAKYLELKMKSGTDFDRAYVEAMVKDHHDDLESFLGEESKMSTPDLKAAVQKKPNLILILSGFALIGLFVVARISWLVRKEDSYCRFTP